MATSAYLCLTAFVLVPRKVLIFRSVLTLKNNSIFDSSLEKCSIPSTVKSDLPPASASDYYRLKMTEINVHDGGGLNHGHGAFGELESVVWK